ncbi:serine/threonine-protein kinase Sgk2 isoform X2 [Bos javanicus]|uniref:serine/threonine-protein kinase Sgk2 isoform X2 n=1 Tax=Bos javanicus TaxID=9906 RepID=UPI002AA7D478|nr:serine/threonine-protein kinase Sgk2 isoform X2 [Bos javanicus]
MLTCIEVHTAVSTHYTTQRLIEAHRHTDQSPMYRRTDKITQTWSHCCTNTLTRRDTLIHQIDRQTHISAWNTCTHTRTPHTHVHSNKPQHHPSSPAAVAHALLPTPPRGRRCPRGNRGLRSLLKPCWLPRDINSSLAAAGSSKLSAGAGPAPGTDTSALVGRTERASCPLSTLRLPPRLLPAASLQAVQSVPDHCYSMDSSPAGTPSPQPPRANGNINLGPSANPNARPTDFDFLKVIGKGNYGKVLLAKHKSDGMFYAVKVLQKKSILKKKEQSHIMAERSVLLKNVRHPFLVGLRYSFQTPEKLYFVLDYVNGGELFFHLQRERRFLEPRARFYAAEVASAIGYLHSLNIIYRDLKPENILLDCQGHVVLTDFGLCKEGVEPEETTSTFCGTPEVTCANTGHTDLYFICESSNCPLSIPRAFLVPRHHLDAFEHIKGTPFGQTNYKMFPVYLFCILFYFWLLLITAHGLSLVAASRGYSLLWCLGFSLG